MKANEAPEKIYFGECDKGVLDIYSTKESDEDIEYTRTDAFIEKASEYFYRCLEDTKVIDDYRDILVPGIQATYTSVKEFIEDFEKYMKGE